MGKNVIVSEETLRDLLEAHASLCAWYYALWSALRDAGGAAAAPDGPARAAFIGRIAADYPELAGVARALGEPRMFVPPPPTVTIPPPPPPAFVGAGTPEITRAREPETAIEPATARARELERLRRSGSGGAGGAGSSAGGGGTSS